MKVKLYTVACAAALPIHRATAADIVDFFNIVQTLFKYFRARLFEPFDIDVTT
jgi:hypothetical protein